METIQEYAIGKALGHGDTFAHRTALKALGMTYVGEHRKVWITFNQAVFERGLAVMRGELTYTLGERKDDGSFDVTFNEDRFFAKDGEGSEMTTTEATTTTLPVTAAEAVELTPINCNQKTLLLAWKRLAGGTIGFDPFRTEGTKTFGEQKAYVLAHWPKAEVLAAVEAARLELGAEAPVVREPKPAVTTPKRETRTEEKSEQGPVPVGAGDLDDEEQALLRILRERKGKLDEARVRDIAAEVLAEGVDRFAALIDKAVKDAVGKPNVVALKVGDAPAGEAIKNAHKQFALLSRYIATGENVLITGPSGCGKSVAVEHYARATGKECLVISCSGGLTEAAFGARLLPGENGTFLPYDSAFLQAYMRGNTVICLDEFDAADSNVVLVINGATSGNGFFCEVRGVGAKDSEEYRKRIWVPKGEGTVMVACANTFGTGATMLYQGRNAMDAASLNRWLLVEMTYDEAIDRAYVTDQQSQNIVEWVLSVRTAIASHAMKRVMSHRDTRKAIALAKQGFTLREVKKALVVGWSQDELTQIGGV